MIEPTVSGVVTKLEKEIQEKFSQSWHIYRIAMHEKGGIELASEMSWKYSTKQLFDIIEILDIHDALNKQAKDVAEAKANQAKKNKLK